MLIDREPWTNRVFHMAVRAMIGRAPGSGECTLLGLAQVKQEASTSYPRKPVRTGSVPSAV